MFPFLPFLHNRSRVCREMQNPMERVLHIRDCIRMCILSSGTCQTESRSSPKNVEDIETMKNGGIDEKMNEVGSQTEPIMEPTSQPPLKLRHELVVNLILPPPAYTKECNRRIPPCSLALCFHERSRKPGPVPPA